MPKFRVKLYWEMCGEVEVDAATADEAQQKAIDGPLPESAEYVSDSANVDPIDVTQVITDPPTVRHPLITQEKLDGIRRIEAIAFQTQPGSCPP